MMTGDTAVSTIGPHRFTAEQYRLGENFILKNCSIFCLFDSNCSQLSFIILALVSLLWAVAQTHQQFGYAEGQL